VKRIIKYIFFINLVLTSCDKALMGPDPDSDDKTCFKIFWNNFDQHYPSFIIKNLNWDSVYNIEMMQIDSKGLYYVLTDISKILNDGHFEVYANGENIYTRAPWVGRISNSPVNINKYISLSNINGDKSARYGVYDNIAYISIQSFSLDKTIYNDIVNLISTFKNYDGIIFDVRDNQGGLISNSDLTKWNYLF
jgi:carboxyl-terminal processing protease